MLTQAETVRMKVPQQRPRPDRQPGTGLVAMTVLHGVQGAIEMIVDPIDSIRSPRREWTVIRGREVLTVPGRLLHRQRQRAL